MLGNFAEVIKSRTYALKFEALRRGRDFPLTPFALARLRRERALALVREECGFTAADPHARPGNQNAAKPKFDPETGGIIEKNAVRNTNPVSRNTDTADYILARLHRDAESHPDPELRVKAADLLAMHRERKIRGD